MEPTENVYRFLEDGAVVCFCSSAWHSVGPTQFYPSEGGNYRFRISASGFQSAGKPVTFRVTAGGASLTGKSGLVGYFDAPPTSRPCSSSSIHGAADDDLDPPLRAGDARPCTRSGRQVRRTRAGGPVGRGRRAAERHWPPESHRRIFGDLAQKPAPIYNHSDRVEVVSKNPWPMPSASSAASPAGPFAGGDRRRRRAVRRARRRRSWPRGTRSSRRCASALMGVLVSPEFLFLREKPGQARRLRPGQPAVVFPLEHDARRGAARAGRAAEAERAGHARASRSSGCSSTPKAAAFTENFVGQWLGLRDIDFTEPSHILYPEFDDMLKVSMVRETELFFDEVLQERPEPDELRRLRLHDAQRPAGEALRHSRRGRLGVPQGDAAAGQPSRRRADDGQRAEGDGQRHDHLAGHARGLGAGPHPGHAAAAAARRRAGDRAGHSRRDDDPRATGQAPRRSHRARAATRRSIRPASRWRASTCIGGWRENYRTTGQRRSR